MRTYGLPLYSPAIRSMEWRRRGLLAVLVIAFSVLLAGTSEGGHLTPILRIQLASGTVDAALVFDGEVRDGSFPDPRDGTFDAVILTLETADARDGPPTFEDRTIMEFDLTGVPVGGVVSATLLLTEIVDCGIGPLGLYGAAGDGVASTTDAEITNLLTGPTGTFGDSIENIGAVDVTAFITALVSGGESFAQFAIRGGIPSLCRFGTDYRIATSEADGDGVSRFNEDAGPNGGDANGDGILDSTQPDVASLNAEGPGYVTVEVSGGCGILLDVDTSEEADAPAADAGFDYPFGLVEFRLPCASASVRIFFHGATSPLPPYRKYGPLTPGDPVTAAWYTLPGTTNGTAVVGGVTVHTVTLSLVDGALGDATGVDGMIVDPGGVAAALAPVIPTLGSWGVATLSILLLAALALALRRIGIPSGPFKPGTFGSG